jgi:hypothetical protein
MNSYDDKRKRAMRRKNHIARDLRTAKYRQKRIDNSLRKQDKYPIMKTLDFDIE